MSYSINNSGDMLRIAEYCAANATEKARNNLTNPRNILEYILNFFFCGAVRSHYAQPYEDFSKTLAQALLQTSTKHQPVNIPETLIVDFSGYTITFLQPGENNSDGPVTVKVSGNGENISADIDKGEFNRICTALLLRSWGGLPPASAVLTDDNRMKLRGANLSGMNLSGLDLRGADLKDTNLDGTILKGANLSGADFRLKNIFGGTCTRYLTDVDMSEADLSGANFQNVCLDNVKLIQAILSDVDMSNVIFKSSVDMSGANLSRANLSNAQGRVVLSDADLRLANLKGAQLQRSNLQRANLAGTNLSRVNFYHVNLQDADLHGASLRCVDLAGARLNGARLSHLQMKTPLLEFSLRHLEYLDRYLNHINNPASGSILTAIDSIDPQYVDIKLQMARELIAILKESKVDLTDNVISILDILSKDIYASDSYISESMNTLCENDLRKYEGRVIPYAEGVFNQAVKLFRCKPELMFRLNGGFIQIIAQGMAENSTPEMREKASSLYDIYLQNEKIKPYCDNGDFGDYSGKPDWSTPVADNYILMSSGKTNDVTAMMLSQAVLDNMLRGRVENDTWSRFYLYKGAGNCCLAGNETPPADKLFSVYFPLFNVPYQYTKMSGTFPRLVRMLNLGAMETHFLSALNTRFSRKKFVSENDQKKLREIFSPKLMYSPASGEYSLNSAHYNAIINMYDLASASDTQKAKKMLCLAAVFTRYSSSAFFGTEYESPEMLRFYAYALMKKAYDLDAGIFSSRMQDWRKRLLGLNGASSCTETLSAGMVSFIRSQLTGELDNIMPPLWG